MKQVNSARQKRHKRIRVKIYGLALRPRVVVHRSLNNFSAQLVDDSKNITLLTLSTYNKKLKEKFAYGGNTKAAASLGEIFAEGAKGLGITKVVFDRSGYLYHGRVKAFAESLRTGGLEF